MARTPGRKASRPNDVNQVEEVEIPDIAKSLGDIAEKLHRDMGRAARLPGRPDYVDASGEPLLTAEEQDAWPATADATLKQLLRDLAAFRTNYDYWERVAAEFALRYHHFTQRETAQLLNVGVSTINRWAQHPVGFTWEEAEEARRNAKKHRST